MNMANENEFWKTCSEKIAGKFIVLDGPDGCGKSTQIKLLAEELARRKIPYITVRDPGDTRIGDSIRKILLGPEHEHREMRCELLLFMASRAQLVAEKIKPALAAGKTDLCDRYVSASLAYQGAGGLPLDHILDIARFATQETWPHLTIVLDLGVEVGLERIRVERNTAQDTMERRGLEYHRKVRDLFVQLPTLYPAPVILLPAGEPIEKVQARLLETLSRVDY
jgi:dTMP kinase